VQGPRATQNHSIWVALGPRTQGKQLNQLTMNKKFLNYLRI
jgi:hypothetical protein